MIFTRRRFLALLGAVPVLEPVLLAVAAKAAAHAEPIWYTYGRTITVPTREAVKVLNVELQIGKESWPAEWEWHECKEEIRVHLPDRPSAQFTNFRWDETGTLVKSRPDPFCGAKMTGITAP